MKRLLVFGLGGFVVLAALSVAFGTWYTIEAGSRGVVVRNGVPIRVAEPGLGFKLPLIDAVERVSIRSEAERVADIAASAQDGQPATLTISLALRVPAERVEELQAAYGSRDGALARAVRPAVRQEVRTVLGGYTAARALRERSRLEKEIATAVREAVNGPIVIEAVRLEEVAFSDAFRRSEEIRLTAQADADAIRLRGEADAAATRARRAACVDNPARLGSGAGSGGPGSSPGMAPWQAGPDGSTPSGTEPAERR